MKVGFQKFEEEAKNVVKKGKGNVQETYAGIFSQPGKNIQKKDEDDFDPDVIPPNWDSAQKHRDAWTVGKKDEDQDAICPCCTRHIGRKPLTINSNQKDLSFLGSGLPLYQDFIKACILILLIFFITSGDYNIITNYQYGKDCTSNENCPDLTVNSMSLANKRHDGKLVSIQQVLNLVSIIVLIIVLQFFRKTQRELDEEIDNTTAYSSDYSILVSGIPKKLQNLKNNDQDDDLKDFFTQKVNDFPLSEAVVSSEKIREQLSGQQYQSYQRIVSVNLCYRLDDQVKFEKQQLDLITKKQKFLSDLYEKGYDPLDESIKQMDEYTNIQSEINKIEQELQALAKLFYEGQGVEDYFLGTAIVTFQWESDRQQFLQRYKISFWAELMGKSRQIEYKDQMVNLNEPAEPTDVFWENLHFSSREKTKRRALSNILTLLILGFCAGTVYFITMLQTVSTESIKKQTIENALARGNRQHYEYDWVSSFAVKLFSIFASVMIVVINSCLAYIILRLSEYNAYTTQTQFNVSVASKSGTAQFINTAIITFLISSFISKNIFGSGGLVQTQTTVFFTNTIIKIITDLIDAGGLYTMYKQYSEKKKGNKSVMTQQQANIFMEKPAFVISSSYGLLLKNMYVTAFYATMIPISLVVSAFQLTLFLWLEKLNITQRRTIKFNYGPQLSYEMTEYLEFVLPIYCATNFYWQYTFSEGKDVNVYAIIGIVLGLLNALLPMQIVNKLIFPSKIIEVIPKSYVDCEENLLTDYARENPATREKAREDYSRRIKDIQSQRGLLKDFQFASKGGKSGQSLFG